MNIVDVITSFIEHREAKGCARGTLRTYSSLLHHWQIWLNDRKRSEIADISVRDMRAFFAYLRTVHTAWSRHPTRRKGRDRHGLSVNTVDAYWRVLQAVWVYLEEDGELPGHLARCFRDKQIPRQRIEPRARNYYRQKDVERILAKIGKPVTLYAARNRAMTVLLFESGMRIAELCSLQDSDVDLENRQARIVGKGNRERWVFWGEGAAAELDAYLQRRSPRPGPLFRSVGSRSLGAQASPDAFRRVLYRLRVPISRGSPAHAFRHGFVHRAIDAGIDISQVQQLVGHTNITTTMLYAKERPDKLREVHAKIFAAS